MKARAYLYISGTIFGIVGLLHLGRSIFGVPVMAGGWEFPFWLSWPGGIIALALCVWAYRLAGKTG